MKPTVLFKLALCAAFSLGLGACSDSDEPARNDEGSKVELPAHRMFVLNQGTWNQNNASLAFIDPDKTTADIDDIYLLQNGMHLGDTGNAMLRHGNDIFVAVHTSNCLVRLNSAGVETGRLSFVSDADLAGCIRYIADSENYVYASFYGGYVLKINASTMAVEKKVKTSASNCEGIAVLNGCVYVADAYEVTFDADSGFNNYIYHNRVLVCDSGDLSVKSTVEVGPNPNKIFRADGMVFVLCLGNYWDRGYELWMIDTYDGNKASMICAATEAAAYGGNVYIVDSETDWSTMTTTNTFSRYNIAEGKLHAGQLLKDAPAALSSEIVSMMSADPSNGDIYVGVTHYASSNGKLYRFSSAAVYKEMISSGGQHPIAAVYFE